MLRQLELLSTLISKAHCPLKAHIAHCDGQVIEVQASALGCSLQSILALLTEHYWVGCRSLVSGSFLPGVTSSLHWINASNSPNLPSASAGIDQVCRSNRSTSHVLKIQEAPQSLCCQSGSSDLLQSFLYFSVLVTNTLSPRCLIHTATRSSRKHSSPNTTALKPTLLFFYRTACHWPPWASLWLWMHQCGNLIGLADQWVTWPGSDQYSPRLAPSHIPLFQGTADDVIASSCFGARRFAHLHY